MQVLGVDVGGSGIKAAPVDTDKGEFSAARRRIDTPRPSTPAAVAATVGELAAAFGWRGPIGCTMPTPVRHGVTLAAANIDRSWIGCDARARFADATGCPVAVLNDADAAGSAEMRFGAGRDRGGVVILITLGTGIGTALFLDGRLVPNTELGHIEIDGRDAEEIATDRVRKAEDMKWKDWAENLDRYLCRLHFYLRPELIIIGGGVSKKSEKFIPRLTVDAEVVPAQLLNDAGIVGAALAGAALAGAASAGAASAGAASAGAASAGATDRR